MAKQNTLHSIHVQRNDTKANWAAANPVLLRGEMGVEIDTRKFKFGDGTSRWLELEYVSKDLEDAVAAEKTRAEAVEKNLGARIDAEATRLDAANTDIGKIRNLLKDGASLDDTKAALLDLGENYKDLYAVASTLHTFIDLPDSADVTINRWKEIEAFLADIADTETLTGLLDALKDAITKAYTAAIAEAETRERTRAMGVEQGLDTRLTAAEGEIESMQASFDGDVNEIIDGRFSGDVFILEGGDAEGWSIPE